MAVQQNKKSPSKRGMHRSHDHLSKPALSVDPQSGETHLRHRITPDGFYRGKRVIVAGLDQDYLGRPFEPMPQLLAIAEYITKTLAICVVCGAPANRTYRKVQKAGRVVVGGSEIYEARCRRCFDLGRRARPLPEPEGDSE